MKMRLILLLLVSVFAGVGYAQQPKIIKLPELQKMMDAEGDKIQVFNFWATWCGPCVKELPLFEKLAADNPENVEVTLVSMDLELDPNPEKVYRFVTRKNLRSRVVLLDEQNPNEWIDKIEKQWSGALPATIVINPKTGQRKFVGKALHEDDLEQLVADVQ